MRNVLLLGTGQTLNKFNNEELKKYTTVGCNFIYKKFVPDYLCVKDVVAFFNKAGWNKFESIDTTWVFSTEMVKHFKYIPEHVKVQVIEQKWNVNNVFFDLVVPFGSYLCNQVKPTRRKVLFYGGIGGSGYFYDQEGTNKSNDRVHNDVFEKLEKLLKVKFIEL